MKIQSIITLIIITLLLACHPLYAACQQIPDHQLDSIFNELDNAIKQRHIYAEEKAC